MRPRSSYRDDMVTRFWKYHNETFRGRMELFERPEMPDGRPPVFLKPADGFNVITAPDISRDDHRHLMREIPLRERHRWFRSMSSSQAIALSVFGNLKMHGCLNLLNELRDEHGHAIFGEDPIAPNNFRMEYKVDSLGEPRPTSIDALIMGRHAIAIECKLMEAEVGSCSRPRLKKKESNYERDHCDGTYTVQREREKRCSLTEIEVKYWDHVPRVFKWVADGDHRPCPLRANYQLVRNLLSVSVPSKALPSGDGHVVLVYDDRNPAFQKGGRGYAAYEETRCALRDRERLKRCSWQKIVQVVRAEKRLAWLADQLDAKYGI